MFVQSVMLALEKARTGKDVSSHERDLDWFVLASLMTIELPLMRILHTVLVSLGDQEDTTSLETGRDGNMVSIVLTTAW